MKQNQILVTREWIQARNPCQSVFYSLQDSHIKIDRTVEAIMADLKVRNNWTHYFWFMTRAMTKKQSFVFMLEVFMTLLKSDTLSLYPGLPNAFWKYVPLKYDDYSKSNDMSQVNIDNTELQRVLENIKKGIKSNDNQTLEECVDTITNYIKTEATGTRRQNLFFVAFNKINRLITTNNYDPYLVNDITIDAITCANTAGTVYGKEFTASIANIGAELLSKETEDDVYATSTDVEWMHDFTNKVPS